MKSLIILSWNEKFRKIYLPSSFVYHIQCTLKIVKLQQLLVQSWHICYMEKISWQFQQSIGLPIENTTFLKVKKKYYNLNQKLNMWIKLFINLIAKAKVQKIKYIHTSTSSKIKFCLKGKYRQSQGNYRK